MARNPKPHEDGREGPPVRYAVVGLGYIAQAAVLPAFAHARENSVLTALVSNDGHKLRSLGRRYGVKHLYSYEQFGDSLRSGVYDAVYVALPNSMHADCTIEALNAGVHVLCEKPMATTAKECLQMIDAAARRRRRLMIAYRLHFEQANLEAVRLAASGRLGELRFFTSTFAMNVRPGDIRLDAELGGGPVPDIGIYCINAARYLFRAEPYEAVAASSKCKDPRFREVPEMVAVTLRFPQERLATFLCGFNAGKVSEYRLVGTEGELLVDPAYELADDLKQRITIRGRTREKTYPKRDQFAPELVHFSDCIQRGREPSPSGEEGLADVRIIEAIAASVRSGKPVPIDVSSPPRRPSPSQEMRKRPVRMPRLVAATPPGRNDD